MDGRSVKSRTSIEVDLGESIDLTAYHHYIAMMEEKYENTSRLLEIAEQLIEKYEHENNDLKKTNQKLMQDVIRLTAQVQNMKQTLLYDQGPKFQSSIADLAKRDDKVGKQIKGLAEELFKSEAKIAKLTRQKQQKIEKDLHNFFEFPTIQMDRAPRQKQLSRQIRSLKWKLQQKDEQIIYMIKRNKMLEQNQGSKSGHKRFRKVGDDDRFYTCQTEPSKNFK